MAEINKNQLAGQRGGVRRKYYEPDSDCLRRFNYSNGRGWRTKNTGHISFGIKRIGEGRRKHNVGT